MNNWRWPLLAGFCAALTACPHPHSDNPVKTLSDAKQACLQQMRTKLIQDGFRLAAVDNLPELADVNAVNAGIDKTGVSDVNYKLIRDSSTGQISSLETTFSSQDFSVDATLSQADSDSVFFYGLNLQIDDRLSPNVTRDIQENFNVTQNCELKLSSVTVSTASETGDQLVNRQIVRHMDGRAGSKTDQTKSYRIPQGAHLLNSLDTATVKTLADFHRLTDKYKDQPLYLNVNSDIGVTPIHVNYPEPIVEINPFTNQEQKFNIVEISLDMNGSGQFSMDLKEADANTGYLVIGGLNSQTWTLPKDLWDRQNLSSKDSSGVHSVEVDTGTTAYNAVATITTTRKLDDSNLAAYWTILDEKNLSNDPKGWIWEATIKPKIWNTSEPFESAVLASDADRSGPDAPYLSESDYIHYKIPQLRPLLAQLQPYRDLNRLQMAEKILAVVQSTIKYDTDSLQQAGIYPLTTEDILSRKEGVCQHYAILFASLARAMGLPTKVIMGYVSGGKGQFGGHAWNEIEVQPGVWRPIEPQGSLEFDSYDYIPIGEAYLLENKDLNAQSFEMGKAFAMTQFDLHLRPGQ